MTDPATKPATLRVAVWIVIGWRNGEPMVLDVQDTYDRARMQGERYDALGYDDVRVQDKRLTVRL